MPMPGIKHTYSAYYAACRSMPSRTPRLKNSNMVNDGAVDSVEVVEDQGNLVDIGLDKAEVGVVKVLGYVEDGARADGVMGAEITGSTMGQMGDGVSNGDVSVVSIRAAVSIQSLAARGRMRS
jgi:hypothetical protein